MSSASAATDPENIPTPVPWLTLLQTLILTWLVVFQLVQFVPMMKYLTDRFGVPSHPFMRLLIELLQVAPWAPLVAAGLVSVVAIVNRCSFRRLALLTTLAITTNVATLIVVTLGLFKLTRVVP
jgi:hypothetical protein